MTPKERKAVADLWGPEPPRWRVLYARFWHWKQEKRYRRMVKKAHSWHGGGEGNRW